MAFACAAAACSCAHHFHYSATIPTLPLADRSIEPTCPKLCWPDPCPHPGRSFLPVMVCLLGVAVEGRYPTQQELAALLVLRVGVMLAVWQGAVTGKPWAIVACMTSVVSGAVYMTWISKLLRC